MGSAYEAWTVNLQIVGLLYDAFGIIVLGVPALRRMVEQVGVQCESYWDYNKNAIPILSFARVDTTAGSILLLTGFVFQFLSLLGFEPPLAVVVLLVGALVVVLILYYAWLRKTLSGKLEARVTGWLDENKEDETA